MKRDDYKLIKENWDNFVNEEEERIDEIATGIGFLATVFQPLQEVFKALKTIGEVLQKKETYKDDPGMSEGIQSFIDLTSNTISALQKIQEMWDGFAKNSPKLAKILIVKFAIVDIVGLALSKFLDYAINKLNAQARKAFELAPEELDVPSPEEVKEASTEKTDSQEKLGSPTIQVNENDAEL